MTDNATEAQNIAARPRTSTWLTANAGSGKTRVLTNRVARLLLDGARPESILCLTYTTAAASEMQNRLFKTLGSWAMLSDQDLTLELQKLGEPSDRDLGHARTLFASAIEAPGGLKIQTIHSFCSKILRQFPLEARVNPQFTEIDENQQVDVLRDAIGEIATDTPHIIDGVRKTFSGDNIANLARDVAKKEELFQPSRSRDDIFSAFGVPPMQTIDAIVSAAISRDDIQLLKSLVPLLRNMGSSNDHKLADAFASLDEIPSTTALETLDNCLLTKGGSKRPFTFKTDIPTNKIKESAVFAPIKPPFVDLGQRIEEAHHARIALEAANGAHALQEFAGAFLPRYQRLKSEKRLLDFDDLIRRTRNLLTTRSLEWVLYRLDARIDHVLVDEAQDTSPTQWDVIEALISEMVTGSSSRKRTLFVVGDKKQSIYSFQGADAAGYDARGKTFRETLTVGSGMEIGELLYSFRSSPAILSCVDAVFAAADGTGEATNHIAFHNHMPGRVDLWPLVPQPEQEDRIPWYDPRERTVENDAAFQLAYMVADEIAKLVESGTIPDKEGEFRRVTAGDIMVLVQRRSKLFDKIISACKARDLPIAGADRLKVGSELAVRDILALLSFLALPEDDLSLAAALRSPLFGWTEQDLFDLAARRLPKTYLWQSLRDRRDDFPTTFETLTDLRNRVDFLRPFELMNEVLIKHRGRYNFLKRLGAEAEDGIDELLSLALSYERNHVPSLTGFLEFAKASDIDVKREAKAAGNLIRVMTVHGAKGLESPIVILPDTTLGQARAGQAIVQSAEGIATLTRGKDKLPPSVRAAQDAKRQAEDDERDRLLYVAMTRAEKWLIVCGVKPSRGEANSLNWHKNVEDGLKSLDAKALETPSGSGWRHQQGRWVENVVSPGSNASARMPDVEPVVFGPLTTPKAANILSPSMLDGEKALVGEALEESGGTRKGRMMHLLLEHLPGSLDPAQLAGRLLADGPDMATPEEIGSLLAEAQRMIAGYPEIFGPDTLAEVDIVAELATLQGRVSGTIDRLMVSNTRVLAVDFKTNAIVPKTADETPEGILRQMGAYLEALEEIYPERTVDVAILWTSTGTLMPLGHGIVREALQRATTS